MKKTAEGAGAFLCAAGGLCGFCHVSGGYLPSGDFYDRQYVCRMGIYAFAAGGVQGTADAVVCGDACISGRWKHSLADKSGGLPFEKGTMAQAGRIFRLWKQFSAFASVHAESVQRNI